MGKRVNPQFITKWGGGFRDQILSRVPRIPGGIDSFVDPQGCRLLPKDDAARSRAEFWVVHESCEVAKVEIPRGILRWWFPWADDDSLRLRMTHETVQKRRASHTMALP